MSARSAPGSRTGALNLMDSGQKNCGRGLEHDGPGRRWGAAEWDAVFRDDIVAFLDDELIDGAIEHGRPFELAPLTGYATPTTRSSSTPRVASAPTATPRPWSGICKAAALWLTENTAAIQNPTTGNILTYANTVSLPSGQWGIR